MNLAQSHTAQKQAAPGFRTWEGCSWTQPPDLLITALLQSGCNLKCLKTVLFGGVGGAVLATPQGMQDLSSSTRDRTHAPYSGSTES